MILNQNGFLGSIIEDQTLKVHFASNEDVNSLKKTKRIFKQNK